MAGLKTRRKQATIRIWCMTRWPVTRSVTQHGLVFYLILFALCFFLVGTGGALLERFWGQPLAMVLGFLLGLTPLVFFVWYCRTARSMQEKINAPLNAKIRQLQQRVADLLPEVPPFQTGKSSGATARDPVTSLTPIDCPMDTQPSEPVAKSEVALPAGHTNNNLTFAEEDNLARSLPVKGKRTLEVRHRLVILSVASVLAVVALLLGYWNRRYFWAILPGPEAALGVSLDAWTDRKTLPLALGISFSDPDRSEFGEMLLGYEIEGSRADENKSVFSVRLRMKSIDGKDHWEEKAYSVEKANGRWRIMSLEDYAEQVEKFERWLNLLRSEAKKGPEQEEGRLAESQIEIALQGVDVNDLTKLTNTGEKGKAAELHKFMSLCDAQADRLQQEVKAEQDPVVRRQIQNWLAVLRK